MSTYPPDGWNCAWTGTWGVDYQLDNTAGKFRTGTYSLKMINTALGADHYMLTDDFPVHEGMSIAFEAWVMASRITPGDTLGFVVVTFDAAGNIVTNSAIRTDAILAAANTWEFWSGTYVIPTGGAIVKARVFFRKADTAFDAWIDSCYGTLAPLNRHVPSTAAIVGSKLLEGSGPLTKLSSAGMLDNLTSITTKVIDSLTDGTYARPLSAGLTAGVVNSTGLVAGAVTSAKLATAAVGVHQSVGVDRRASLSRNVAGMHKTRG